MERGRQVDVSAQVGRTRTHSPHTGGTLRVVGQRERKVEVERESQLDVSAYVGRELQRLFKDTPTTYRR